MKPIIAVVVIFFVAIATLIVVDRSLTGLWRSLLECAVFLCLWGYFSGWFQCKKPPE